MLQVTGLFGLEASLADLRRSGIWPHNLLPEHLDALAAYDALKAKCKRDGHTYLTVDELDRYIRWILDAGKSFLKRYYMDTRVRGADQWLERALK